MLFQERSDMACCIKEQLCLHAHVLNPHRMSLFVAMSLADMSMPFMRFDTQTLKFFSHPCSVKPPPTIADTYYSCLVHYDKYHLLFLI